MRVLNRTGAPWTLQTTITLPPGEWVEAPTLPWSLVMQYARELRLEVDWEDYYQKVNGDLVWGTNTLLWMSPFSLADGYGTASESTIHALLGAGFELFLQPCWFAVMDGLQSKTIELLDRGIPERQYPRVGLCMATPGEFNKLPTPYRIGLTMYESSDPLKTHPEWSRDLLNIDRLFVPSRYCKEIFSEFCKRPINVLPLATNSMFDAANRRPKPKDTFTFLMHGSLTSRKAPLETLECFLKAFPKKRYPHVRIKFKTRLGLFGLAENQLPYNPDPERIEIYNEDWYAERLLQEFLECDAYLFPSRGEGFGMTPREAMAAGMISIFSDNTGLTEVAHDNFNWPIPMKGTKPSPLGGEWFEPDWDYLIDVMRDVVDNREAAYKKARRGSLWYQRCHGAAAVARKWSRTLSRMNLNFTPRTLERVSPAEVLTPKNYSRLLEEHREFLKAIQHRHITEPGTTIWDLGVGSGFLHVYLRSLGFRVIGLVDPNITAESIETLRERIRACGVDPELYPINLYKLRRTNLPKPQAVLSQGCLQQLWRLEAAKVLKHILTSAPGVPLLFSVPSLHYEGSYLQGAQLRAMDSWWHVLQDLDVRRSIYYGGRRQHMFFQVEGFDLNIRGVDRRHLGRTAEGVWRPTQIDRVV